MRRRCVVWGLGAACVLLGGCAARPRRADQAFWSGRLALSVLGQPAQSLTAAFELSGSPEQGELRLNTPLGTTVAVIRWVPGKATLQRGSEWEEASDLPGLAQRVLGTDVPVASLFDWLQGQATSAEGWTVDLSSLAQGRLHAQRISPEPQAQIRLILDPT